MTSKVSTNKINTTQSTSSTPFWKLMKDDLRHRSWMLVLSCLAAFLSSPVALLFYSSNLYARRMVSDVSMMQEMMSGAMVSYFGSVHLVLQMIVIYVGALIVALFGFRHLFSKRMTDLYHAMPISRGKLFLVQYLNGFLTWFVPFLIGHLSAYIMSLFMIKNSAYFGVISVGIFKEILLLAICFFIVYNACLVPIMLSGNIINSIINILVYGLGICLGFVACICYMERYFDTCYFNELVEGTPLLLGLSPLVAPVYLCMWFSEFQLTLDVMSRTASNANIWIPFLIATLIIMVINGLLAAYLLRKRPSELAERGVDNKIFSTIMRLAASILAGLFLALFFGEMTALTGWMLFGALFGATLTFCIINIMHHASFRALFHHKLQFIASLVVTCGIMLLFRYDLPGYDTYLPAKEDITGMTIYSHHFTGSGYGLIQNENGYYTYSHNASLPDEIIFNNPETIYPFLELMAGLDNNESQKYTDESDGFYHNWDVCVYTKTGSYYRTYRFYETEEIQAVIAPFVEDKSLVEHYNPIGTQTLEAPPIITAFTLDSTSFEITDTDAIQQLYDAYALDFATYHDLPYKAANYKLIQLDFLYPFNELGANRVAPLYIPAWYTNTIQTLEKLYPNGSWSIDDLYLHSLEIAVPSEPVTYQQITEEEKLEELRPYLYLSYYQAPFINDDYMYVGTLYANTPNNFSTYTYECYVKRSEEIPAWLKELLNP